MSAAASAEMMELLLAQQRNDRLLYPLPLGVEVAHKTGELKRLRNDAGIVFAPSGPYIFVALVDEAANDTAARAAIVDLSRAAYSRLESAEVPPYYGLPPRLAQDVFQVPDAEGRLVRLDDAWAVTSLAHKAARPEAG